MKALSVRQPGASMIAAGTKTLEIRSGRTTYRGQLLICASLGGKRPDLPEGVAVCRVEVVGCRPMTRADERAAGGVVYRPGHFARELSNVKAVAPVAVKGAMGIFNLVSEQASVGVLEWAYRLMELRSHLTAVLSSKVSPAAPSMRL
jgi:hypothetical protein